MNKIKIVMIAFLIGLVYSCTDAIDITQPGLIQYNDLYKSVSDLQDGLSGLYSGIDNSAEIKFNAVYTDEISIGVGNGGQAKTEYGLDLNSTSTSPATIWINNVILLDRVNRLLEASVTIVPKNNSEQDQYDNILGQIYAIRAYEHFVLEEYFTVDMTDDSKLGGVIMDRVFKLDEGEIPRKTNGEVFSFIDNDLLLAESLIHDTNGVTYFGKDAINALKARMYAYRGKYNLSEPLATQLLASYPLANQTQFTNLWKDDDTVGVIFKLERTRNDSHDAQATSMSAGGTAGSMFSFGLSGGVQSVYLELGRSLFNLIDPNDIRYTTYVDFNSSTIDPNYMTSPNVIQSDVIVQGKYLGSESEVLMNDLKVFRSAEMLFLIAESRANSHDYTSVATLLKQLKDARFGISTPLLSISSDQEAFAAILNERRVELCLEGFRWLDLKRLGDKANLQIDRDPRDCEINGVCTMSNTDHRFTLPIPSRELDNNANLEQNPGY